jgi:hypothetical protein
VACGLMCDAEWKNRGEEDGKVIKEEERNKISL